MHFIYDDFIVAAGSNIATSAALTKDVITCVEAIATLNLDLARNVIDLAEDMAANTEVLLGANNVQERLRVPNSIAQSTLDKSIACSRRIFDANSNSQSEFARLIDTHFGKMHSSIVAQTGNAAEGDVPSSDVPGAIVSSTRAAKTKRAA